MDTTPLWDGPVTSLYTDHYELTMLQAALHSGASGRRTVFEAFARALPEGRRYGIVAGTGRLLEGITRFHFGPPELEFLDRTGVVNGDILDRLADFRFSGDVWGYPEGEAYFPYSPVLIVESTFAEACVLETFVLSVLNHDSAIASAASRMVSAAGGRPCIEMGSRRTHEEAAAAAARAAIIAGFEATSNLEAGRRYGLRTVGTAAHSFMLLHDTERDAFRAQLDSLGPGTTLLADTYDVEAAVRTAVELAGDKLGAVRLDSGDLVAQAKWVRELLDSLGNVHTKIVVTSDLDEYSVAALRAAPADAYGVGTALVTGSGAPTAGLVYKLVGRANDAGEIIAVAKSSMNKTNIGGRKHAVRRLDGAGTATHEVLGVGHPPAHEPNGRPLLRQFIREGELLPGWTGAAAVARARQRHAETMAELPVVVNRLQRGDPAIPTVYA